MSTELSLPLMETNSIWVEGLNLQPETVTVLEGILGEALQDAGVGDPFWVRFLKGQAKVELDKQDPLSHSGFCTAKA